MLTFKFVNRVATVLEITGVISFLVFLIFIFLMAIIVYIRLPWAAAIAPGMLVIASILLNLSLYCMLAVFIIAVIALSVSYLRERNETSKKKPA
jgi:Na+/phosphate symporter